MSVIAKMVNNEIQLHPETKADSALAGYLLDLIKKARTAGLSKSAGAASLLKQQAEEWEERSRDPRLAPEIRSYLAGKARDAKAEAGRLD